MISPVEEAAKKLRDFLTTNIPDKEKLNEAETRLLIIDEILGILGWSKSEYNPEIPASEPSGYTDYRLSIDGQYRLIVEAKRKGHLQPLPKPIQHPQYENSFLYNNCGSEMKSLLEQCRRYCASCGLYYAVATTGNIWIILLNFKYGVEWGDLKALVFHSLEDVLARFSEFYGLISREAVKNHSLEEKFGSMFIVKPPSAIRPGESITHSSNIEQVSYRQTISTFFDYFMTDITRPSQKDMLEHCYVSNPEINDFSRDLQQIIRYDAILEHTEVESQEASVLKTSSEELESQAFSGTPRTILLIGNIGAGKSTFIHKFVQDETENNETRSEQRLCALVDLIDEVTTNPFDQEKIQRIAELVLNKLIELLKEKSQFEDKLDPYSPTVQRVCFESMLARFRKRKQTLYQADRKQYEIEAEEHLYQLCEENKYDYLVKYIQYLRKKRYKTWIAFDNIDRGSYSHQEFIYGFAHRLAKEAYCVTLLTLRQDTFQEAQENGFLDVRGTDTVFQLHAPQLKDVVSRRRKYIDRMIELSELPKQFKGNLALITLLNEHLKYLILLQESSKSIRTLITTFSMNNVRHALGMLANYYTSPHSTFHEFYRLSGDNALPTLATQFNYEIEQTRFLQAIMLRNKWNYEEKRSDIFNLFSVDPFEKVSHFLMLRILAYLNLKLNSVTSKYSIKYINIYNDFVFLGYQGRHVNNAILRLQSAGLLISPNLPTEVETLDPLPQETKFILSPKGYYYLQELVSQPYYQTRVGEDTVWYDEQLAKDYIACLEETGNAQKSGTDDVLQATEAKSIFVRYLRLSLLEEAQDSGILHTSKEWAQLMNRVVEEKVFGVAITTSDQAVPLEDATIKEKQHSLSKKLREYEDEIGKFYDNYYKYPVELQRKREKNDSQQLRLFEGELYGPTVHDEVSLRDAVASLGFLPKGPKTKERSYALIVLWVLEVAFRAGLGSLTAKEIAEIARTYGSIHVAASRISSFLRQQKSNDGEFKHLWDEEPLGYYVINSFGRNFLEGDVGEKERDRP